MLQLHWFLNMRFRGKPNCMCGSINTMMVPSHASRTSSCIDDDLVFLIMSIVIVTRMLSIMRTHCYQNNGLG